MLDYFDVVVSRTQPSHRIFAFDMTREVGQAERALLTDLCLHCGFDHRFAVGHSVVRVLVLTDSDDVISPRVIPHYLTGERRELLEYYPELGYLRDLVFLFKQLMVPTSDALPKLARWTPSDATLQWQYKLPSKVMGGEGLC